MMARTSCKAAKNIVSSGAGTMPTTIAPGDCQHGALI